MGRQLSRAILWGILTYLGTCSLATAAASADAQVLAELKAKWREQASSIFTADVRFRIFRRGDGLNPISFEELKRRIDSSNLAKDQDSMRDLVRGLAADPIPQSQPWGVMRFRLSGSKSREDTQGGDTQITDQETKVELDSPNRQVLVHAPGMSRRGQVDLKSLRWIPFESAAWSISSSDSKFAVLQVGGRQSTTEMRVDRESGAMVEEVQRGADGHVMSYVAQRGFVNHPGGVLFPTWTVRAQFDDAGILQSIDLQCLEAATFNGEIPESVFKLATDAGTTVIDFRTGEKSFRTAKDTDNIVAAARDPATQTGFSPKSASGGTEFHWRIIIFNLAVLAIFVGFWLLRGRLWRKM
jgi:hypothetical protein